MMSDHYCYDEGDISSHDADNLDCNLCYVIRDGAS